MKMSFSNMQNFTTMNSVRRGQGMATKKSDANSMTRLPNGSLPPQGHVNPFEDPHLNITGKDPSEWRKTVPVDQAVTEKLKNLIKEDFVKRSGMSGSGSQADAQANIIKAYVATLPGEQKLSAIHSCQQIASDEAERLVSIIKKQNPSWQFGQPFDTSILDEPAAKSLDARV